jgi:adenylate kinase family enzyme
VNNRIAIIGTSGAGKTSFSRELSSSLGIPHIELDEYYWSESWVKVPGEQFRSSVNALTAEKSWIMDGNYGVVRDVIWSRADTIVWLDYSFSLTMKRLFIRSILRLICRTRIWHGNMETFGRLFSRDSIIWWGISTYSRRRREFAQLWKSKELQDTELLRFNDPEQATSWLRQLQKGSGRSANS